MTPLSALRIAKHAFESIAGKVPRDDLIGDKDIASHSLVIVTEALASVDAERLGSEVSNQFVARQKMDSLSRSFQRLRSITENDFPPCLATAEIDLMERWLADLRTAVTLSERAHCGREGVIEECAQRAKRFIECVYGAENKVQANDLYESIRALASSPPPEKTRAETNWQAAPFDGEEGP